ncbi:ImmA/IrrE family metallo-endopeptidase [Noviherbaspirillum sp. UKPF54]|uniref:ImmA/IrrE family metallo-endopeptidase n=1 Tax=Noviherbaspirillum sp. UKPF54 TaxID=2601898 RepID=UPI0011B14CA6|nr:ImmA/IrrE family metallo-endopeptidase [Noviherbaspirillum sp. UKPF54]QDZ26567.1 ImmA/IrrE family metallo-endopeptidase [Noviherbaspirillum sp. UKPF54]
MTWLTQMEPPLPEDVSPFAAYGTVDEATLSAYKNRLEKKNIIWHTIDAGDGKAGSIALISRSEKPGEPSQYKMAVNRNHNPNVRFATLAHELGHLFLGHLGKDKYLNIPERPKLSHAQVELEAESVSYIICSRNGIKSKAESYLSTYVSSDTSIENLDLYQIMRAAGQVENILGLSAPTKYDRPSKAPTSDVNMQDTLF